MIIPAANQPKKALGTALWALTGSTVMLVLITLAVTAILGPHQGSRAVFPFLSMVRAIYISVFLERVEMLALFAWGFGIFIAVSVFILRLKGAGPGAGAGRLPSSYRPLR